MARNEEGSYERKSDRKLNILFNDPNVVGILKSRIIRWTEHIWRVVDKIIRLVMNISDKLRPRGKPR